MKELKDYTSKELYDLYIQKYKDENKEDENSLLNAYTMFLDCGRMGEVYGLFLATEEDIENASGKPVEFGEILGKHSNVYVNDFDKIDIDFISNDPHIIKIIKEHGLETGYNPLNYLIDDED